MKIPVEHFNNTPVFALSPSGPCQSSHTCSHPGDRESRRLSIPPGPPGLLTSQNNSVGSAPSSPRAEKRSAPALPRDRAEAPGTVPTISSMVWGTSGPGPVSLPHNSGSEGRYATLPKKYCSYLSAREVSSYQESFFFTPRSRRMSWISPRDLERQKLEGSLLTVCTGCKDMVLQVKRAREEKTFVRLLFSSESALHPRCHSPALRNHSSTFAQVIRTSRTRTTRRMQMVRSMFLNLPGSESVREHRL